MLEKVSNYIVDNILYKGETIDKDNREIMIFGVTRIVEDIPKYVAIFILCYLLNILKEAGVVLLVTILYKSFIGGAHARSNIGCFIYSAIYFVLPVLLVKYVNINDIVLNIFYILTYIFSVYIIIKIAPADTEEIPIINKGLRLKSKILSSVFLNLIYLTIFIFIKNIEYRIIAVSIIAIIDIMATKPLYRLLRCKYGWESEEYKHLYATKV